MPVHPHFDPALTSSPKPGTTMTGGFTITLTAEGDDTDLRSLVITKPESFKGATATLDPATDRATLSVSANAEDFAAGQLVVSARAEDVEGQSAEVDFTFYLATAPRAMVIDGTFASYRD